MARRAEAQWWAVPSLHPAVRRALRVVRLIVGAPDYQGYLEHCATSHPDRSPLSAREYYTEFINRRFSGGATRCC